MVNRLVVIAALGLTAFAVCVGAAAAIGGSEGFDGLDSLFSDGPRCRAVAGAAATRRELDWDGSWDAGMAVAGHARYTPGRDDKVHVTGDPQVLAHLRVRDGNIEMDCRGWRNRQRTLQITLPGREFRKFSLAGVGSMTLDQLDQHMLKVEIAGTGTVEANGKVDDIKIEIGGLGHADFGKVASRTAKVELAGVAKADIAPTDLANIEIAGPSEVTLHSNPARLETEIAGPGRIRKVPADR